MGSVLLDRQQGRSHDAVGLALGALKTGSDWRASTADRSLVGFAAHGTERIAELYYRMKINETLALTPDFQLIDRAGGDSRAPTVRLFGIRANLSF